MKYHLLGLYFFFKAAWLSCGVDVKQGFERGRRYYKVKRIAHLDARIDESSGLVITKDSTLLSHNDSDGAPTIYEVDFNGILLDSIRLPLKNIDWEDIAISDDKSVIYIADTGNNLNKRKDLRCYAYHRNDQKLDTLKLKYSDQEAFPPPEEARHYDCEAVSYHEQDLHFFSKNRGKDRKVRHYYMATSANDEELALTHVEEILLHQQQVTASAISPDKQLLALLTYGKIYLFRIGGKEKDKWFSNPWLVIKCNRMAQSEGLTFTNNHSLVFSNEKGKLFSVELNKRGRKRLLQAVNAGTSSAR